MLTSNTKLPLGVINNKYNIREGEGYISTGTKLTVVSNNVVVSCGSNIVSTKSKKRESNVCNNMYL